MSVVICPWCQSEISQEEGQEPDKICPVCDNELDGYRTLKLSLGEEEEEDAYEEEEAPTVSIDDDEDLSWMEEEALESSEELEQFEETLEELLNEQEVVPECPSCREYMVEAGERLISAEEFKPRVPESLGVPLVEAPFKLTMYVCPSCFTVQSALGDTHRQRMVRSLSEPGAQQGGRRNGNA
ncbi:hypothetical protein [Cohnella boryungensis]|uniref:Uncharacterized protein n=1 Tax=Cohnella boryungensis TaxID=768479 RepID=A0ABV8SDI8_9BACL